LLAQQQAFNGCAADYRSHYSITGALGTIHSQYVRTADLQKLVLDVHKIKMDVLGSLNSRLDSLKRFSKYTLFSSCQLTNIDNAYCWRLQSAKALLLKHQRTER